LAWYDQRSPHTKAYDRHLLKQLVNSTIEEVSLSENVGYDAIVRKQEMKRLKQELPSEVYAQDVKGTL
jgi:hypothetical protein